MSVEFRHGDCLISDDRAKLDVDAIHAFLTRSYWAADIPREVVARSLANSLCLGIYTATGEQIGLVRVISDYATFAYLCDVYVLEAHRCRGLGKALVAASLAHPDLQGLRRLMLATASAHAVYAPFGFAAPAHPDRLMEILRPDLYLTRTESY